MIEDGCIKSTMESSFQMEFIDTNDPSEIQVTWQNFYFRSLTTPRQRVSYLCTVAPCPAPPCGCSSGRKRRAVGEVKSLADRFDRSKLFTTEKEPINGKFRFWIDVFKTKNDLSKARQALEEWENERQTAFIMKNFALITSSILLVLTFVIGFYMFKR